MNCSVLVLDQPQLTAYLLIQKKMCPVIKLLYPPLCQVCPDYDNCLSTPFLPPLHKPKVARKQAKIASGRSRYSRVPVGESFSPSHLRRMMELSDVPLGKESQFFHLDLGHIPPPNCNTFLFQLLVEGCVRLEPYCPPIHPLHHPRC